MLECLYFLLVLQFENLGFQALHLLLKFVGLALQLLIFYFQSEYFLVGLLKGMDVLFVCIFKLLDQLFIVDLQFDIILQLGLIDTFLRLVAISTLSLRRQGPIPLWPFRSGGQWLI
jgi:hypothetical protein